MLFAVFKMKFQFVVVAGRGEEGKITDLMGCTEHALLQIVAGGAWEPHVMALRAVCAGRALSGSCPAGTLCTLPNHKHAGFGLVLAFVREGIWGISKHLLGFFRLVEEI